MPVEQKFSFLVGSEWRAETHETNGDTITRLTMRGTCYSMHPTVAREFAQAILMACDKADELNGEKK